MRHAFLSLAVIFLILLSGLMGPGLVQATSVYGDADVWTDKPEYVVGETVTIYARSPLVYCICHYWLIIYRPDGSSATEDLGRLDPGTTTSRSSWVDIPGQRRVELWMGNGENVLVAYTYFNVIGGPADLTVTRCWVTPPNPERDDSVTFHATIANIGGSDAFNFGLEVYLDGNHYDSDSYSLSAGERRQASSGPWRAEDGWHEVRWIINPDWSVEESDHSNNEARCSFTVSPPAFDFEITASPSTQTIKQGESTSYAVKVIHTKGDAQDVSLSVSGLPPDASYFFSESLGLPTFSTTLDITTSLSVEPGSYKVKITGTGGGKTRGTIVTLVVQETPFEFTISASPSTQTIAPGNSTTFTVAVNLQSGAPRKVTMSATGPSGISFKFEPSSATLPFTSTLTVATEASTPPGSYTLTISGKDGGKTYSTTVTLTLQTPLLLEVYVLLAPDFPEPGEGSEVGITGQGYYYSGDEVQLHAPEGVSGPLAPLVYYFLAWIVDGNIFGECVANPKKAKNCGLSPDISIPMDTSHKALALYIERRMIRDYAREYVNYANSKLPNQSQQQFDSSIAKKIAESARSGQTVYTEQIARAKLVEEWPTLIEIIQTVTKQTKVPVADVVGYMVDIGNLARDIPKCKSENLSSKECEQVKEDLVDATSNVVIGGATYLLCAVVLGATTGPGALACGVVAMVLAKVKVSGTDKTVEDLLGDGVRSSFEWLWQKALCHVGEWLFKRVLCGTGQSRIGLLVVDPDGRRTGAVFDGDWTVVTEIPNAWYSGLDSHPQYIVVSEPELGSYKFVITGRESGGFHLNVTNMADGSTVSTETYSGRISQGETQEYASELTPDGNVSLRPTVTWWDKYSLWLLGVGLTVTIGGCVAVYRAKFRRKRGRFCIHCGAKLRPKAQYCLDCGASQETSRLGRVDRDVTSG